MRTDGVPSSPGHGAEWYSSTLRYLQLISMLNESEKGIGGALGASGATSGCAGNEDQGGSRQLGAAARTKTTTNKKRPASFQLRPSLPCQSQPGVSGRVSERAERAI